MNNLSIKNQLLLLSIMALVVIFAYSIKIANNAYTSYTNSITTLNIVELSIKASSVLHALQKERGATTGFLETNDKKFTNILLDQRSQTNKRINELKEFEKEHSIQETSIIKKINLSYIKNVRKNIDSKSIITKTALDFYTSLNKNIIDNISYLSTIPRNVEVRTNFSSFIVFLSSKEKAGIERAILSAVFAADKFSLDLYAKFSALASEQKHF